MSYILAVDLMALGLFSLYFMMSGHQVACHLMQYRHASHTAEY